MFILWGLVIVALVVFVWYASSVELPCVYQWGEIGPHVVIVSGTHGNESAPARYLEEFVKSTPADWDPGFRLTIVPYVNPKAIALNRRTALFQRDVNRHWSNDPTIINSYLMPLMATADMVLDLHEAWGTHVCTGGESLGQTLYSNHPMMDRIAGRITDRLNARLTFTDDCYRWTRRYKQDHIPGALDEWCTLHKIPYMLAEITGQNDIVPMRARKKEAHMIVTEFLKYIA